MFSQVLLRAETIQTHIPNGIWVPIGINSIYRDISIVTPWASDISTTITDVADDKYTYVQSTNNAYGYALPTGLSPTTDLLNNTTIFDNATIGIFAILGARDLNGRPLNGTTSSVSLAIGAEIVMCLIMNILGH